MKNVVMKYMIFLILIFNSVVYSVTSPHGELKTPCENCHTPVDWQVNKQNIKFDHNSTGYPLIGAHKQIDCKDCHSNLVFHQTGVLCMDCHTDVHRGQLGKQCESCHSPNNWENRQDLLQKHSLLRFPLYGAHERVDCEECHNNGLTEYANSPVECIFCHAEEYNSTQNPSHREAQFSTTCEDCHSVQSFTWQTQEFDHSFFPLTGAHQNVTCSDCHHGNYTETPNTCYGCHESDYTATTDPNHRIFNFQTDCSQCHLTDTWATTAFDHYQTSGFELVGSHQSIECSQCHVNNQVTGLSQDCYGCHETDYNSIKEPDHQLGQYPHECTICHNVNIWSPADFDHNQTAFPLNGAHQAVECTDCHQNNVYAGTPQDCYSCHDTDFNSVTDPNHVTGNFDHICTICHSTTAWTPATFDHNQTAFPLTGAHQKVNCTDCHQNNVYAGTLQDCYSCHDTDFNSVTDPNHVTGNFDHICTICHSTTAWTPATFDHNQTAFPLTGAHQNVQCVDCHENNVYAGTPQDCYSCHDTDFKTVTEPNHITGNFDHICTVCHSTTAWSPATFDHNQTAFPLTGAHQNVQCIDCHENNVYAGTSQDCYSCHDTDYNTVTDPNHVTNNFDHICTVCHSTIAWVPATFDHNTTAFPLTGAHTRAVCLDCHQSGYTNTPSDCYFCHETEYNNTTDPNHASSQFPVTCLDCHNTNNWDQTTWDHDGRYFPIYSGKHRGEWDACSDCHTNSSNYQVFECINCHAHQKSETDREHNEVRNYQYLSSACYNCHPNGKED